ncbi:MAG TPA: cysteine synthase A [Bacillota bacterium]|nr:cysteine synthase A [Bacillota bacterium]HPE38610.1 cysteine synthase A [Bacillota bacterium]
MSDIKHDITELIGNTPLLELTNTEERMGLTAKLLAKVEFLNPAGSVKDRVAMTMINEAEKDGTLRKGMTIIEPTSGNTGIGLAAVAAAKGYHVVLTMPDTMSIERRKLAEAFGAECVLTEGALGMMGAIARAEELVKERAPAIIAGQFTNSANPLAHYRTTGPEIMKATDGHVDIFIAGVGTGGTITGTGRYLKEQNPNVRIIAVEPSDSPVLSGGKAGPHALQGIGAGFVPSILNVEIIDEIITVTKEEAYTMMRDLAKTEGLFVGVSSGAAAHAAAVVAARPENRGKNVVVLLPDTGDRYLSIL